MNRRTQDLPRSHVRQTQILGQLEHRHQICRQTVFSTVPSVRHDLGRGRWMSAGDGGCRPGTAKTPSSADNGRPAVIHMLGRDGRSWRRPVPGRQTGRLRSLQANMPPASTNRSQELEKTLDSITVKASAPRTAVEDKPSRRQSSQTILVFSIPQESTRNSYVQKAHIRLVAIRDMLQ